jgi:two-component system, chemotaxis family, protein-glutamate methylesterase/glutaminase
MEKNAVRKYEVVVIGGSAGSLEVVLNMVGAFQEHTNTTFIIVLHRKNDVQSILEELLSARTSIKVKEVEDKDPILPNNIYIAPPNYHLLIEDEKIFSLDCSEKVHFSRPSIDITFESVAQVYGTRAIGVLLSGANADGAEGLAKIKRGGGYTIVQDPSSSDVSYMPEQAIKLKAFDKILHAEEIAEFINRLISEPGFGGM